MPKKSVRSSTQNSTQDLAIIGGGPSTVCLLDALATGGEAGALTVFEPSPHLWRGRPFAPDVDAVRVNAPPSEMSVRAGDSDHFGRWLAVRDLVRRPNQQDGTCPISGSRFVSRHVFGDYLEHAAREALHTLVENGWTVRIVRDAVRAVERGDGELTLRTQYGDQHAARQVVLCVGGGPPADPYGLAGRPGTVLDPYPVIGSLREIPIDAAVGVVGTGLTAIDTVLALASSGHRGPLIMASRSGILPAVRQRVVEHELTAFSVARLRRMVQERSRLTLAGLVDLMREELATVGEDLTPIRSELRSLETDDPVERLRRNLSEVDTVSRAMRILQRCVPDTGPDVWPYLAEKERGLVLGRHKRALMSLCCPMPPASATALLRLVDAGQLTIRRGLCDVRSVPDGFAMDIDGGRCTVDVVVNAVNAAGHRIPPRAAGLITSLVETGLAERHPRGGLRVDRPTSQLLVHDTRRDDLYALGDLAAGSLLFTFGVPSLVDRAVDIAAALRFEPRATAAPLASRSFPLQLV